MTFQIIILIFLLVLSGLFSSSETAFTSLSLLQKQRLPSRGWRGRVAQRLSRRSDILLTTILISNNLVNIGASALASKMTIDLLGSAALGAMTGLLTLLILIFGEVTPKQIAISHNESVAISLAPLLLFLSWIFRPFIWFITAISNTIMKLVGHGESKNITLDHLLQMVQVGEALGVVEDYEKEMVKRVFRINDTPVQSIMTHRKEVFSLPADAAAGEVAEEVIQKGFARIPLYGEHPEEIVGIVLDTDIFRSISQGREAIKLKEMMEAPLFIPHSRRAHKLLTQFKREKLNLAVVLDEYGGMAGVVSREDVIEEIFGELYDENEIQDQEKIEEREPGVFRIQGETTFFEIQDHLGLTLPHSNRVQTFGGYIIEQLGRIPAGRESFSLPQGNIVIEKMDGNRIASVRFTPRKELSQQEDSANPGREP